MARRQRKKERNKQTSKQKTNKQTSEQKSDSTMATDGKTIATYFGEG